MAKQSAAQPAATDQYASGMFKPVIEQCDGCERIVEADAVKYCRTYTNPGSKWKLGICNFATHKKPEIVAATIRVNPLKAAKRASSKRG